MEPFMRVAFWTVALFCSLQARPLDQHLDQHEWNIKSMGEHVTCEGSTFYTPTNVPVKCFVTALDCVLKEFEGPATDECKGPATDECEGPATDECEGPNEDLLQAMAFLNKTINELKEHNYSEEAHNSSECDCHKWPQTPFSNFLYKTQALLQQVRDTQVGQ